MCNLMNVQSRCKLLSPSKLSKLCYKGRYFYHRSRLYSHSTCKDQDLEPQSSSKLTNTTFIPPVDDEATLYVHWPFCKQICTFCNFNKYVSRNVDHQRMRKCLVTETETLLRLSGVKRISSVYFGGGTPSLAESLSISSVLESVSRICHVPTDAEVTLEANPTSVETRRLRHFRSAGINRLSLGIQAFNPRDLFRLGRDNTIEDSLQALQTARSIFPGKVSVDLMFGRPHQTLDAWYKELLQALSVCDDHVSLYQLTLERGTPLHKDVKSGKISIPSSDVVAEMYQLAVETLLAHGFHRYEVANFARRGAESRHNLSYWNGTQYIGVGPGAHGRFIPGGNGSEMREARVQTLEPSNWMKEVETRGHATRKQVPQTKFEILEEVLMLSLRTADGLSNEKWQTLSPFGNSLSLCDVFKDSKDVQDFMESGLLLLNERGLKASHIGLSLVDSVVPALLLHLDQKRTSNPNDVLKSDLKNR